MILKIELQEKWWIQIDSLPEVHQLYTLQNRRSLQTTRLIYGLKGMKYIIQIYEDVVNGHDEKEGLPTEYRYEFEQ